MDASLSATAVDRKRPVNLTLSTGLVAQAKAFSPNLSATVESLLAAYVADETRMRKNRQAMADQCADDWNRVLDAHGSFADEHVTF